METPNVATLRGQKVCDVYNKVYDIYNTMFSDQMGQFPTHSQRSNKYIMVMVEINSNATLVEPLTSRKNPKLIRAYRYRIMMMWLKRAGIIPKKHIMDNKALEITKEIICNEYQMELELVPPGYHQQNTAEVAIRNSKVHFLIILVGIAQHFPPALCNRLLP